MTKFLIDEEVKKIMVAVGHDGEWHEEEEFARVLDWAQDVVISYSMLQLILDGKVEVTHRVEDGEPRFRPIVGTECACVGECKCQQ